MKTFPAQSNEIKASLILTGIFASQVPSTSTDTNWPLTKSVTILQPRKQHTLSPTLFLKQRVSICTNTQTHELFLDKDAYTQTVHAQRLKIYLYILEYKWSHISDKLRSKNYAFHGRALSRTAFGSSIGLSNVPNSTLCGTSFRRKLPWRAEGRCWATLHVQAQCCKAANGYLYAKRKIYSQLSIICANGEPWRYS